MKYFIIYNYRDEDYGYLNAVKHYYLYRKVAEFNDITEAIKEFDYRKREEDVSEKIEFTSREDHVICVYYENGSCELTAIKYAGWTDRPLPYSSGSLFLITEEEYNKIAHLFNDENYFDFNSYVKED